METVCDKMDRVPVITIQMATDTSNDRMERERSNGDILYVKARELSCRQINSIGALRST